MQSQDIVNEINRKLNGEFEIITYQSDDWNTISSTANENIDLYNRMANWRTSYNPMYSVGTVGDSPFYPVKLSEIAAISGSERTRVLFYDTDNTIVDKYKLVAQDIFDQSGDDDKVVTLNMQGLQTKPKVSTDKIYDTNIVLPVYENVNKIIKSTDKVVMDDIYWLIDRTAADLASTSPVAFVARNYDNFNKQADLRLKAMKKQNIISQASTPAYGGWTPSTRPDGR